MIPKWRMVRYTDDGCNLYQCLQCKGQWEGRDAPGWYDGYVATECLVEGGHQYTKDGKEHYYAQRDEPLYHPDWTHCPLCGVKWDGPVRCNIDNERMLGERRALAYQTRTWKAEDPGYWFIVFAIEVHCNGGLERPSDCVHPVEKIHPRHGVKAALKHTRGMEVKVWKTVNQPGCYEERFILRILTSAEVSKIPYLTERYL